VYHTQVSGDIAVIAAMPNFLVLYGQYTQIYGNLSSLIGHQKLRELYVNNLTNLEYIVLFRANLLSGDCINLINKCRDLYSIVLSDNPNIYGDLNQLQIHDKLQNFNMWYTGISGDIANFTKIITKNFIPIRYHYAGPSLAIWVHSCSKIYGDIQVFSSLDVSGLEVFDTQVIGDISALANCINLQLLRVNNV